MKRTTGMLAAAVVVLSSAPAFACHRHLFFWHHCNEPLIAAVPVPMPPVIPIPIPMPVAVAAPMYVAEPMPMPQPPMVVAQAAPALPYGYTELPPVVGEPVAVSPAPVYAAPGPVYVTPVPVAPIVVAPPPAPVVVAAPMVVTHEETVQRLAAKWMPGISAPVSWEDRAIGPGSFTNNIGVEARINRYFAVRGDLELRNGVRNWDIPGIKLSAFPGHRVHPFASISLSITQADATPGKVSLGYMAAAGLDITLFRYFFITGEVRYSDVPGNCCALPRVTGLVGAGVQFL
jgi:hypothetical protein